MQSGNGQKAQTDILLGRITRLGKKNMKRCLILLAIIKIKIKTTVKCHCTPIRMVKIKNSENTNNDVENWIQLLVGILNGTAKPKKSWQFLMK